MSNIRAEKIREATTLLTSLTSKGEDPRTVARAYDITTQRAGERPVFCVLGKAEWRGVLLMVDTLTNKS